MYAGMHVPYKKEMPDQRDELLKGMSCLASEDDFAEEAQAGSPKSEGGHWHRRELRKASSRKAQPCGDKPCKFWCQG